MRRVLVLALLCSAALARADTFPMPGARPRQGPSGQLQQVSNGASTYSCDGMSFPSSYWGVSQPNGTTLCEVNPAPAIGLTGACIGDLPGDFCGEGNGNQPNWLAPPQRYRAGGLGVDGDFVFNGEDATSSHHCAADGGAANVCRGGTCSGTFPNGICTLAYNSPILRSSTVAGNTPQSVALYQFSSLTMTSGTLTVGTPGLNGGHMIIYVSGDVSISGSGTIIDERLKGFAGGAGGAACTSSAVGKAGGAMFEYKGGTAGTAATTSCTSNACDGIGFPANFDRTVLPWYPSIFVMGSGGGSQTAAGTGLGIGRADMITGPTGGGSGGCAASCTGTVGAGGIGAGTVLMIVGGTYNCLAATWNASGQAGANGAPGGGGGAGGFIHIQARLLGTDTCTYTVSGGAGGTLTGTNCGIGGPGAAGLALRELLGL